MRSILPVSCIFLTVVRCSAIPEQKPSDTADNLDDITQTDTTEDTDMIGMDCTFSFGWNVTYPVVSIDDFVMPHLMVTSTCEAATITELQVGFTGTSWISELSNTQLSVGTEFDHVGVYSAFSDCRNDVCEMQWTGITPNPDAYPAVDFTAAPDADIRLAFTLVGFYNDENLIEIDELWDDVNDDVFLSGLIHYEVDGVEETAFAETTISITPE